MSLLFCEGFDQFEVLEDIAEAYPGAPTTGITLQTTTALGRGRCVRLPAATTVGDFRVPITPVPSGTAVGAGIRVRVNSAPSDSTRRGILGFLDNATVQFRLLLASDNSLRIDTGGTGGFITGFRLAFGIWYHIEVKYICADSGGYFEVRVDGTTVYTFTGDTRNAATGTINWAIGPASLSTANMGEVDFDDWVVWDGTGTSENDWLGDVEVQTEFATANDVVTDWTANTGTHWDAINDAGEDGDATFISTTTVNSPASFVMSNLEGSPNRVLGAQITAIARKSDSGNRSIRLGVVSNAVVAEGADVPLGLGYSAAYLMLPRNPDGNVAWTPATFNAALARVRVTV